MLSSNEVHALEEAILRAERGQTQVAEEELPEGIPAAPVEAMPSTEYAAFYVNSILYFSPENWMVWLNGKKFFSGKESPLERLSIQSVDKKSVTFLWQPVARPQSLGEPGGARVEFEPDGKVRLTLAANQIFMVSGMRVLEGRGITRKVKEMLARNEATLAAKQMKMAAGDVRSVAALPPDRDKMNMDKLVSQYRHAGDMLPGNKTAESIR